MIIDPNEISPTITTNEILYDLFASAKQEMEKIAHNISDAAGQNQQVGRETIHSVQIVHCF